MNIYDIPGLTIENGHLCMDGLDVVELTNKYGSPLYIGSEKRIMENVREVTDVFRQYHPNTFVHYASKAETSTATMQIVRNAGGKLEVNSGGELYKGLNAGFDGEDIVFNGVAKSKAEIEAAIDNTIKSINVDSEFELDRIIDIAGKKKKTANVIIRIVPDVASGVAKGIETGTHECKFGTMMEDVADMVRKCQSETYINLKGFHLHIGTQTYHLESFIDSFDVMLGFCQDIYKETGYMPQILDIGGGLPIPYFIDPTASQYIPANLYLMLRGTLSTDDIAAAICKKLHSYDGFFDRCELIIEPGRKIVGDAFMMVSTIENKKYRKSTNESWLMLDAGLNVMSEVKNYHWYFPMVCANKIEEPHIKPFKFGGPLCESGDVWMDYETHKDLPDFRMMPESVDCGDMVAMLETGAYGTSMMNRYNGRPMTGAIIIREDKSIIMAKKPETYEDLIVGEERI